MEVDNINSNYIPPTYQPSQTTETTSEETSVTNNSQPADQSIASRVDLII